MERHARRYGEHGAHKEHVELLRGKLMSGLEKNLKDLSVSVRDQRAILGRLKFAPQLTHDLTESLKQIK